MSKKNKDKDRMSIATGDATRSSLLKIQNNKAEKKKTAAKKSTKTTNTKTTTKKATQKASAGLSGDTTKASIRNLNNSQANKTKTTKKTATNRSNVKKNAGLSVDTTKATLKNLNNVTAKKKTENKKLNESRINKAKKTQLHSDIDKSLTATGVKKAKETNDKISNGKSRFQLFWESTANNFKGSWKSLGATTGERIREVFNEDTKRKESHDLLTRAVRRESVTGINPEFNHQSLLKHQEQAKEADEELKKSQEQLEAVKSGYGKVGKFLIDVAQQGTYLAGDVALGSVTGGVGGLAEMAGRAAGAGMSEARSNGVSNREQFRYGTLSAGVEVLTEKIFQGTSLFRKAAGKGAITEEMVNRYAQNMAQKLAKSEEGKAVLQGVTRVGMNAVGEGAEEVLADALNPIIKKATEQEGEFDIKEALYDGLIGAVLGGAGGGVSLLADNISGNNITDEEIDSAVKKGLNLGEESTGYKIAQEIKAKQDAGEAITSVDKTDLVRAVQSSTEEQNRLETQEDARTIGGMLNLDTDTETDSLATTAVGEELEETASKINNVLNSIGEIEGVQPQLSEETLAENENVSKQLAFMTQGILFDESSADLLSLNNVAYRQAFEEVTGETLPATNQGTRSFLRNYLINKKAELQQNIESKADKGAVILTREIAKQFGEYGQNGYTAGIDEIVNQHTAESPESLREKIENFSKGYIDYYIAGSSGIQADNSAYLEGLNKAYADSDGKINAQLYKGFLSGGNDKARDIQKAKEDKAEREKKKNNAEAKNVKERTGTFVSNAELDEKEEKAWRNLAKNLKVNIVVEDSIRSVSSETGALTEVNGYMENGTIHISKASDIPAIATFAHEFTHTLQQTAPEEYEQWKQFVTSNHLELSPEEWNAKIRARIDDYRDAGVKLTVSEAEDEILADSAIAFFTDADAIQKLCDENKTLAEKIIEILNRIIEDIKALISGNIEEIKAERSEFYEALGFYESARDLFMRAVIAGIEYDGVVQWDNRTAYSYVTETEKHVLPVLGTVANMKNPGGMLIKKGIKKTSTKLPDEIMEYIKSCKKDNAGNYLTSGADFREAWIKYATENSDAGEKLAEATNSFLQRMFDTIVEDGGLEKTYEYVDFSNSKSATMKVVNDINTGEPVRMMCSCMVKNGEYAINFDFSTICKKREAMTEIIKYLTSHEGANGGTLYEEIELGPESINTINNILKKHGLETACPICFVDTKRVWDQKHAREIAERWNAAQPEDAPYLDIDKAHKAINQTEIDKSFKRYGEKFSKINKANEKYNEEHGLDSKNDNYKRISAEEKTAMLSKEFNFKIKPEFLVDPTGVEAMKGIASKFKDKNYQLYSLLKNNHGQAAGKETVAFSPYSSEILVLADEVNKTPMGEYLKSIAGVRIQSFSDFQIENMFDYFQMIADMATRVFPGHAYTKELIFAEIFGMTGLKINLSAVCDVDPTCGKEFAGLTLSKEKKSGSILDMYEYNQSEQSVDIPEAIKLENKPGYGENCGIIMVGLSYWHCIRSMMDSNIRMLIPYHKSSKANSDREQNAKEKNIADDLVKMGLVPKDNLDMAKDYTKYQNAKNIVKIYIPNNDKEKIEVLADIEKDSKSVARWFKQKFEEEGNGDYLEFYTWLNKEIEAKRLALNFSKKTLHGAGDFDVYTGQHGINNTNNVSETVDAYMMDCVNKGRLPVFWNFVRNDYTDLNGDKIDPFHKGYYKMLFDFSVQYDVKDGEDTKTICVPQESVQQIYPGFTVGIDNPNELKTGGKDKETLVGYIENFLEEKNKYNKKREEAMGDIIGEVVTTLPRKGDIIEIGEDSDKKMSFFTDSEGNQLSEAQRKYFKDTEIVSANGELMRMYHGTMNKGFTVFDRAYTNLEGDSGTGFYFSSIKTDSMRNYTEVDGADNDFKIQALAELYYNNGEIDDYDEAIEQATKDLAKNPGLYEVYLNCEKPYVRDWDNSTDLVIDIEEGFEAPDRDDYDSDDEYDTDYRIFYDEHIFDKVERAFYDAIRITEQRTEKSVELESGTWGDIVNELVDTIKTKDRLTWRDLVDAFYYGPYLTAYAYDSNGELKNHEVCREMARAFVQSLGYDCILDREVTTKFNQMMRNEVEFNPADEDNFHCIVFYPDQIKLCENKEPTHDTDIRFSFGGVNAQLHPWEKEALAEAKKMAGDATYEDKELFKKIYKKTNWFKGADNKWRYFINLRGPYEFKLTMTSSQFATLYNKTKKLEPGKGYVYTLDKLLEADSLFFAYPELETLKVAVRFENNAVSGSFSSEADMILMNMFNGVTGKKATMMDFKATLAHEIQHKIQHLEGFTTGGSDELFPDLDLFVGLSQRNYLDAIANITGNLKDAQNLLEAALIADEMNKRGLGADARYLLYRSLAGEIEARDASDHTRNKDAKNTMVLSGKEIPTNDVPIRRIIRREELDKVISLAENTRFSLAYHAGDLGKSRSDFYPMGGRSTGHFGSGTYFVQNREKIEDGYYKNRPVHAVEFDNYRLFKAEDSEHGYRLHNFLRQINNYIDKLPVLGEDAVFIRARKDDFNEAYYDFNLYIQDEEDIKSAEYVKAVEVLDENFGMLPKETQEYILGQAEWAREECTDAEDKALPVKVWRYSHRGPFYSNYVKYVETEYKYTVDASIWYENVESEAEKIFHRDIDVKGILNRVYSAVSTYNPEMDNDSASTVFMKELGYEGIDVRDTELDNTTYGSVIYNLRDSDIRYSISKKVSDTDKLKRKIEELKNEFKKTNGKMAKPSEVRKLATDILKENGADFKLADSLAKDIERLFADIKSKLTDKSFEFAMQTAEKIIDTIPIETGNPELYKEINKDVRSQAVTISKEDASSIPDFTEWKKLNVKYVTVRKEGKAVEVFYEELCELYPDVFDSEISHPADQLTAIVEEQKKLESKKKFLKDVASSDDIYQLKLAIASQLCLETEALNTYQTFADKKEAEKQRAIEKAVEKTEKAKEKEISKLKNKVEELRNKRLDDLADAKEKAKNQVKGISELQKEKLRAEGRRQEREKQKTVKSRKEILGRITDCYTRLEKKLLEPSDTSHIPESFRGAVALFLEPISFETKRSDKTPNSRARKARESVRFRTAEIAAEYRRQLAESGILMFEPADEEQITLILNDVANMRLEDLNQAQLEALYELMRILERAVNSANKSFNDEISEGIYERSMDVVEQIKHTDKVYKKGKLGEMMNSYVTTNIKPGDFFKTLGSKTLNEAYLATRKAFNRHVDNMTEVRERIGNVADAKTINKWRNEIHKFDIDGEEVRLTTTQLMSLYELSKREQGMGHIFGAGIIPADAELRSKAKKEMKDLDKAHKERYGREFVNKRVHIDIESLQKMLSELSDEQIAAANKLQNIMGTLGTEWGNETSMILYNYKKYTEKHYFPIQVSQDWLDERAGVTSPQRLRTLSMTKPVVPRANNPVVLEDIFSVTTDHMNKMSMYTMTPALTDFERIWNFKDRENDIVLREEFRIVYGENAMRYISNFMNNINGFYTRDDSIDFFDKMLARFKRAKVGASLRVLVQQPTSILRAGIAIRPAYLIAGMTNTNIRKNMREMWKYSSIARWKSWGFYDTDTAKSMESIITNKKELTDITMGAYGAVDNLSWTIIWNAVKAEAKKTMESGTQEYWEKVTKRFEEIIDATQVVDTPYHRSQIMRSKNVFAKSLTSFMAEPTTTVNMLRTELVLAAQEWSDGKRKEATIRTNRVIQVILTTGMAVSLLAGMVDAMRHTWNGDDDDDDDKGLFSQLAQKTDSEVLMFVDESLQKWNDRGNDLEQSFSERILAHFKKNLPGNINPLQMLPGIKDIFSIIDGYSVERADISLISNLYDSLSKFKEYLDGESDYSFTYIAIDVLGSISEYAGIPIRNITKDSIGLARTFAEICGHRDYSNYLYNSIMYSPSSSWAVEDETTSYLQALKNGNKQDAEKILSKMAEDGVSKEQVLKKAESALKYTIKSAAGSGDKVAFNDAVEYLKFMGKSEDDINTICAKAMCEASKTAIDSRDTATLKNIEKLYTDEMKETGYTVQSAYLYKIREAVSDVNTDSFKELSKLAGKNGVTQKEIRESISNAIANSYKDAYLADDENSMDELRKMAKNVNYSTKQLDLEIKKMTIKAQIRNAIENGDTATANSIAGRYYSELGYSASYRLVYGAKASDWNNLKKWLK